MKCGPGGYYILSVLPDILLLFFIPRLFVRSSRRVDFFSLMVPLFMVPLLIVPLLMVPSVVVPDIVPVVVVPVVPGVIVLGVVVVPDVVVVPGVVWAKAALVQRAKAAARKRLETFMEKGETGDMLAICLALYARSGPDCYLFFSIISLIFSKHNPYVVHTAS